MASPIDNIVDAPSAAGGGRDVIRPPVATFTPNMWGDTFTSFSLDDEVQLNYVEAIEALKQEVRSMLMAEGKKRPEKLVLIDTLERLGIAYHFEQEIEDQLQQIFNSDINEQDGDDLFITSLQFRLLRQHRHYVPCSVFDKFKVVDGDINKNKFKESVCGDAKGLLSLYEAAHLRTHGEQILDEALAFTTHHLKRLLVQKLEPFSFRDQVSRALDQPLHRGVQRIETRYYIFSYEKLDDMTRNETLLKLAKLDFNYVQNIYKKELHQVSWWWNELDLISKLPYARDRVVESYLWGMSFRFEPQYSYVRIAVAKAIQMLAVIDDTYDNHATVEEAELFTEAMERWDINEIHGLPNNMKIVYRFVLNLYDEYESEEARQGKTLFAVPYAKKTVKQICRAYNEGLKWFMGLKVPTFDDYLVNSVVTSCLYVVTTAVFTHMKSTAASKETIDWVMGEPKILAATAKMGRYLDDLGSHERESKDGEILTGVEFYMKQHGLSKKETIDKFTELAEDEWKEVNVAWMTSMPCKDMAYQILNFGRATEITYKNCEDGFSSPETFYAALIKDMHVCGSHSNLMCMTIC